jgi:hypothetical protein
VERLDAVQQPRRPNRWVAGEVELDRRGEDANLAAGGVIDEHDLAEAEIGRHGLAPLRRHLRAVGEDAERVAE